MTVNMTFKNLRAKVKSFVVIEMEFFWQKENTQYINVFFNLKGAECIVILWKMQIALSVTPKFRQPRYLDVEDVIKNPLMGCI